MSDPMNDHMHDTLTVWGDSFSAQLRDYVSGTALALHIRDDAPRCDEDGHPYQLSTADAVLLRDVLNAATARGYLPAIREQAA